VSVRVVFLGNDRWSVPSLEAMAGEPEIDVALVVTNAPKPAGRGSVPTPTPVAEAARRMDVAVLETDGVGGGPGFEALRHQHPDAIAVVAYGEILSREVLEVPRLGCVNVHFSLLPRWRGAAPVQRALLAGDRVTGVTVMRMDAGLDTGPILNQLEDAIRPEDDAGSLGDRLARLGGMLLVGVLRAMADGGLPERRQDDRKATRAARFASEERRIDWREPAEGIVRLVRALSPDPGATTLFRGDPLKVLAAGVAHDLVENDPDPGTVLASDDRGVLVAAGLGAVWLRDVVASGRTRMPAADWGRGARFSPDERLG
jgi:methionyl-tRNA formyltransferase